MGTVVKALGYTDRAARYVREVRSGKVPVCELGRLACDRHVADLRRARTRAFKYKYDKAAAERACTFIEMMPHTKGRWAQKRLTLRLEDWQCFEICMLFGWLHKKKDEHGNHLRRFRKEYKKVPRKNGKSALEAAKSLYMLCADGEYGAEIYCGATSEKQAHEVFKPAQIMAQRATGLIDHFGIDVRARTINLLADAAKMEPVIGKPGDGSSPHYAVCDEYHEHDTDAQLDTFETGMGARDQPLLAAITTAGDNISGPCYELEVYAEQVLRGVVEDEELFALIYGIDPDDDWQSPAVLAKANPNMGVSVRKEFLISQQKQAIARPSKRGPFKTKHLNVWVGAMDGYLDVEAYKAGFDPDLNLAAMAGQECLAAVDLASKVDLAALVLNFPIGEGNERFYRFLAKYYVPESALEDDKNKNYRTWAEQGWLTVTPGNVTDYEYIEEDLEEIKSQVQIIDLSYDPFQATQFSTRMMAKGFPVVEYAHTVKTMSEPMKELDAAIRAGRVRHDGNPISLSCVANLVAKEDAKENVYPRKNRPEQRIDGTVAKIMTIGRDIAFVEEAGSVYEERGMRFV